MISFMIYDMKYSFLHAYTQHTHTEHIGNAYGIPYIAYHCVTDSTSVIRTVINSCVLLIERETMGRTIISHVF
jgi:hypothetical protein